MVNNLCTVYILLHSTFNCDVSYSQHTGFAASHPRRPTRCFGVSVHRAPAGITAFCSGGERMRRDATFSRVGVSFRVRRLLPTMQGAW